MTAKAIANYWMIRANSDALRRNLGKAPNRMTLKFRDAVAEIFQPCLGLPTKQHALRVESDALEIGHALRDESSPALGGKTVVTHVLPGWGRKCAPHFSRARNLESRSLKHQTHSMRKCKKVGV